MKNPAEETSKKICQIIYGKKGVNPLIISVEGISSITDYLVIGEGNVERHVVAIAEEIIQELKKEGRDPHHIEGLESGDWVLIDYMDIIVHLFMPGLREKYQIERLFSRGKVVSLEFFDATV